MRAVRKRLNCLTYGQCLKYHKHVVRMPGPAQECKSNECYFFKQKSTGKMLIILKMASSFCFNLGEITLNTNL